MENENDNNTNNNTNNNILVNDTGTSNNRTMDYMNNNTTTKSIINQTEPETDLDSNLEKEAHKLLIKAESLSKPRCCLCAICSSKTQRYNKSCNLYAKAGDMYKTAHQWLNAGICFENCSSIKIKLKESPLPFYEQAYYCFGKIDIGNDSKRVFDKMNSFLEKEGKLFQVGKNYENLGIKYEKNKKYDIAIEHYLQAIKYYEKEGKHENLKTKILIKLTELMMLNNHSEGKIKIPTMLENIGTNYLKNILTKYSAKEYFGKAILTRIYYNDDIIEGIKYLDKYRKKDKTFVDSSMYILCSDIITSIDNNDVEKLNSAIDKYKEINEIDEYLQFILAHIIDRENQKRKIKEKEEEENENNKEDNDNNNNESSNLTNNSDANDLNNKNENENENDEKIENNTNNTNHTNKTNNNNSDKDEKT